MVTVNGTILQRLAAYILPVQFTVGIYDFPCYDKAGYMGEEVNALGVAALSLGPETSGSRSAGTQPLQITL